METITFNYLAIISTAVASFVLGGTYVALFGKQLAKLNGTTDTETQAKQKPNPKGLIGIFLANLVMAFGLAYFVSALGTSAVSGVLWLTFWSFVAFVGLSLSAPFYGKVNLSSGGFLTMSYMLSAFLR